MRHVGVTQPVHIGAPIEKPGLRAVAALVPVIARSRPVSCPATREPQMPLEDSVSHCKPTS